MRSEEEEKERRRANKRRYYASAKGKASKAREDAAYKASGGRAASEARRALKPVSEARLAGRKRWLERNKDYSAKNNAHRRYVKALPLMSAAERAEADAMYEFCKVFPQYEVDHIIPLFGRMVSGLHVLGNLQVLHKAEHRRKSNTFDPAQFQYERDVIIPVN